MLEHAIYSVISPEGAASILWRDTAKAQDAATNMKITAQDLVRFGVIDAIVPEPTGGAHRDPAAAIAATGEAIANALAELDGLEPRRRSAAQRREKFLAIGRTWLTRRRLTGPLDRWRADLLRFTMDLARSHPTACDLPCGCHILRITIIAMRARLAGSTAFETSSFMRALLASAAVAAAVALAGCDAERASRRPAARMAPLSDKMVADDRPQRTWTRNRRSWSALFKEESELEVWKQNRDGQYALLKTYPICSWSGDLGPKIKEGDRQAPEGFYTITPGQMNPNSNYYLAFNTGYPERLRPRLGLHRLRADGAWRLLVARLLRDDRRADPGDLRAGARVASSAARSAFQLQAFPFRMTALNMAKHRNNPNFAFWKMLKEGYDHFEATQQEPKVAVCEKRYVFDAAAPENASSRSRSIRAAHARPIRLDPADRRRRARPSPRRAGQDGAATSRAASPPCRRAWRRRRHEPGVRGQAVDPYR